MNHQINVVPPRLSKQPTASSPRVGIVTMGCKVNAFESSLIGESLQSLTQNNSGGWTQVSAKDVADAYIINTCTVTAEADRQARQEVRRAIRRNPDALVVVTGCYAQMDPQACADIPGVDYVVGNARKLDLHTLMPKMLDRSLAKVTVVDVDEHTSLPRELLSGFDGRSRAFLQIQQGCDQGCTFCIIHVARGRSRSIPADTVVRQAQRLVMNGYRELVICGVDLGAYGQDDDGEPLSLAELLVTLNAIEGDFRIRLSSLDPVHIDDALIAQWAQLDKLCPHLHLSLQSGHTLILKRMKRRYDRELVYDRVRRLRQAVPGLTISADVMVGFPTEDDEHFEHTLSAVHDLKIAWPHTFSYSARDGTPAARIPRQISAVVKKARSARIREAGIDVRRALLRSRIGTNVDVLCEDAVGQDAGNSGMQRSRAPDYTTVYFDAKASVGAGEFARVHITGLCDSGDLSLTGVLAPNSLRQHNDDV